jgi:predicted TIM-barrel fold metal-dependent hydrolase|tara:strand:- start:5106 stop:6302 length:1197 start_codon:yes stop_codon:yes gene_type:complete
MDAIAKKYDGLMFDADNHYYEAEDAFTRYVPIRMQRRCVQWIEMQDGKRHHLVAGKINHSVGNPTFNPVSKPGTLREYYHGNPRGLTFVELTHGSLEPMPPEYMNRDSRVERVKEQGLEGVWLFPTAGILYEEPMVRDIDAMCTMFEGFNRWLDDDWGVNYKDKLFAAPYITLSDVDFACRELEWALERDARVLVMRPSAVCTRDGYFAPSHERFDPFWARVNEAGITVVAHTGANGYTTNGYGGNSALDVLGGGRKPTVGGLIGERSIYDFLLTMAYDKLFERFPNLRIASVENGSGFLADLFIKLEHSKVRMPKYYEQDPAELFRQHVWINPFWEDKISDVAKHMGADRVLFGSDWPHMEGLQHPQDIFDELDVVDLAQQKLILHDNAAALNQRQT